MTSVIPMGLADIVFLLFFLWLFITFLTPQMRYKALLAARAEVIRRLEAKLGAKVITMIHRQERITLFGIPIHRFITIEDSEAVLRAIRSTPPDTPIAMIIHTPGGLVIAASQIARALKKHPAKKIVIVPHYAMSGGTLIALAADEIWMDKNAVLGPLDPQIMVGEKALPAPSILKAVRLKGFDKVSDETLILADIAEKALNQMKALVQELIEDKVGRERAMQIAEKLVSGYYTHDYPITVEELRKMGLNVKDELPEEVYELMELYPQEPPMRPSVEYVPTIPKRVAQPSTQHPAKR
ncbi:MAG: hypothetical protein GXO32_04135 [Crenarchaeota archaeon]|nr:hypothetical protein [Thermoproteota archaeon]